MKNLLFILLVAFGAPLAHACNGALNLGIGPTGVYRLNHAEVIAVEPGLDGCPIDQLALSNAGKAVPIRIVDDGDGRFGANDAIEWIGEKLHGAESWNNPYSRTNAYRLEVKSAPNARLGTRSARGDEARAELVRTMHLEEDQMMMRLKTSQVAEGSLPDLWYWAKLTMVDPAPFATAFDLPGLAAHAGRMKLGIGLRGWSRVHARDGEAKSSDHRVEVSINGRFAGNIEFDGEEHLERTVEVPWSWLRERGNRIELKVPQRFAAASDEHALVDVVMLDYLDFEYPLARGDASAAFRATTDGAPTVADGAPILFASDGNIYPPDGRDAHYASAPAGTHFHALDPARGALSPVNLRKLDRSTNWRAPMAGFDYLIVAHPSLVEASRPLAEFHRRRGLEVALIDVDTLYDQFSHGVVTPEAIRDFFALAHSTWARKPRYALLVGDASFDLADHQRDQRHYAKWADRELLIPGGFGTIPGTPYARQDAAPAARNLVPTFQFFSAEGQSASDNRFVAFADDGKPAFAIGRLPVADADEVKAIVDKTIAYVEQPRFGAWRQSAMFITDDNASFQNASDRLAESVGALGFNTARIYPKESDADNLAHQESILHGLDDGQLLVHFLGHGGRYIWRTGPPDPTKNHDLFTLDDVGALNNAGRLPMVLSMTCYSAPFDNPNEDSIGERFLREPDNGAIAVFAASWRNAPDAAFSRDLITQLLAPGVPIGDAIVAAKRSTRDRDMIEMYNLLGDPAIALQRPRDQLRMFELDDRWARRVAIEVPGATRFSGRLRVEWIDAFGNIRSSHEYTIDTPRLTLPPAPADAAEVRAYALDPSRNEDAIGALQLGKRETQAREPWWHSLRLPRRAPRLAPVDDRIHGDYFDG